MPREFEGPQGGVISDANWNDRDAAWHFLESARWPDGIPTCPHCHEKGASFRIGAKSGSKTRKGLWKCGKCRKQYTVTVATSFDGSHLPPGKWLHAIYLLSSSKRGLSARELHQILRVTHKTARFIGTRIRYAMTQEPLSTKLRAGSRDTRALLSGRTGPISLSPLSFREAVTALLEIMPEKKQDRLEAVDRQAELLNEI